MQGQFQKNFRGRGAWAHGLARSGRKGQRGETRGRRACPAAGVVGALRPPRGRPARSPPDLTGTFRPPPRTSRHETGPSTTFGRHLPTMVSRAKIKPQVDGLRFSQNTGYGRWVRVKRSKWTGFVAGASWMTAGQRLNVGDQADSGQILLSLKKEQARHVA